MTDQTLQAESLPKPAAFPAGLNNAFLFAAFNALSFQIILASPMILYAKSLAASATSPASLLRPYAPCGLGRSSSR